MRIGRARNLFHLPPCGARRGGYRAEAPHCAFIGNCLRLLCSCGRSTGPEQRQARGKGESCRIRKGGLTTCQDANSIQDPIAAAGSCCPELIVANHNLIEGTGTDAVLAICSGQAIPVVFVTANGPDVATRLPDAIVVGRPFSPVSLAMRLNKRRKVRLPALTELPSLVLAPGASQDMTGGVPCGALQARRRLIVRPSRRNMVQD
jgi:hypothetical protein